MLRRLLSASIVLFALQQAVASDLHPGEYLTERGWGRLLIEPDVIELLAGEPIEEWAVEPSEGRRFYIAAVGGNGHQCELRGVIKNSQAVPEFDDRDKPCVVTFKPASEGIQVTGSDYSNCHRYCGARAYFEGLYLTPAEECATSRVAQQRHAFKDAYEAKRFAQAKAALDAVLSRCARTLDRLAEGWIRNDLAITHYRLGDSRRCLEVLEPLAADADKSEERLRAELPPTDADSWIPIAKAARTNIRLCERRSRVR